MYTCPSCHKQHKTFEEAGDCCFAEYVECPIAELPADAELGYGPGKYSYGTICTGRFELVETSENPDEPIRVYPLPPIFHEAIQDALAIRYEKGMDDARADIRRALGLDTANAK